MTESVDVDALRIAKARSYLLRVPVPALRVDTQSVLDAWDVLVVDDTAGDPMTGLKWSRKSTRSVSKTLAATGMAACLKQLHFSLQRNRKSIGETCHPQRDQKFRPIPELRPHGMAAKPG